MHFFYTTMELGWFSKVRMVLLFFVGLLLFFLSVYWSLSVTQHVVISFINLLPSVSIKFDVNPQTRAVALSSPKSLLTLSSNKHDHRLSSKNFGILVFTQSTTVNTYSTEMPTKNTIDNEELSLKEVQACLRKAKVVAESGNRKLAMKLYKHALAMSPDFSETLNEFGEFLENESVVQADLLYQRALFCDPQHHTALVNRKRTAPLVLEHDKKVFKEIDDKKRELYKYSSHHPTLRSAMKEFFYQHIYHTVAIEGNTLSLEQIRQIIDHRTAVAGKSVMEHNEVIGVVEALSYMNNTLLMKIGEVTVNDIKSIHKRVLGYVDPIRSGEFRVNQVFVGGHIPPHADEVDNLMEQFEDWLNSPDVLDLHPVEFAAIAHYRLVYIHPFVDGNGRTARLLMNFILMKNGFPPVSVELKDRWEYYETLTAANSGDIRPFIRFIARCTSKTLEDYLIAADLPYLSDPNLTYKTISGYTNFIPKDKPTQGGGEI